MAAMAQPMYQPAAACARRIGVALAIPCGIKRLGRAPAQQEGGVHRGCQFRVHRYWSLCLRCGLACNLTGAKVAAMVSTAALHPAPQLTGNPFTSHSIKAIYRPIHPHYQFDFTIDHSEYCVPSPDQPFPAYAVSAEGIPPVLLEMQRRQETLFIAAKTQERIAIGLRGRRPQPFVRPARPGLLRRAVMRLVPPLVKRWQIAALRRCGLFDADWYLAQNPDVRAAGVDPALHFLLWGLKDQRDPGPGFSTVHYLRLYPDIQAAGINPLIHYLTAGWDEKRSIHPQMPELQA